MHACIYQCVRLGMYISILAKGTQTKQRHKQPNPRSCIRQGFHTVFNSLYHDLRSGALQNARWHLAGPQTLNPRSNIEILTVINPEVLDIELQPNTWQPKTLNLYGFWV